MTRPAYDLSTSDGAKRSDFRPRVYAAVQGANLRRRRAVAMWRKLVPTAIEQRMTDSDAILAANAAYYRAFSTGDFVAMSRIWADDGVSCVHPGWPALVGRAAILESYRDILGN